MRSIATSSVLNLHTKEGFDLQDIIGALAFNLVVVTASFVLGFGDTVSENVQAGADISMTDRRNATVTWISEGNAATSASPRLRS